MPGLKESGRQNSHPQAGVSQREPPALPFQETLAKNVYWIIIEKRINFAFMEFIKKYETKIVLIIGFILVAVVSFEGGYLQGKNHQEKPLIIKDASQCPKIAISETSSTVLGENNTISKTSENSPVLSTDKKNCLFVGSKNSNKYHLPTCRWAKNIKPENLVCFSNVEEAVAKNYQPDKSCIK